MSKRTKRAGTVTVVIPWWDRPVEWLIEAIASVQEQGVPVHVIVVDNCSSTPPPTLDGVQIVRTPEQGTVGAARNYGLEFVETDTVVFLDADDRMLPGSLPYLTALLARNPDALGVQGSQVIWYSDTGVEAVDPWPYPWMRGAQRVLRRSRSAYAFLFATRIFYPIHGALLRANAVRDAGGFADARNAQDWELAISLALRGPLVLTRQLTYVYRRQSALTTLHGELLAMSQRRRMDVRARIRRRLYSDPECPAWLRSRPARTALATIHWAHNFLVAAYVADVVKLCGIDGTARAQRRERKATGKGSTS